MRRLIDHDPETGVTTYYHRDPAQSGRFWIEETQDVEPYLEGMKQLSSDGISGRLNDYERKGIANDRMHIATLPIGVQYKWLREYGINTALWGRCPETTKRMKRLLNDPENQYLRTGRGKL